MRTFIAFLVVTATFVSNAAAQDTSKVTVATETVYTVINVHAKTPQDLLDRGIGVNDLRRSSLSNLLTVRGETDRFAATFKTDTGSYRVGWQPEHSHPLSGSISTHRYLDYQAAYREKTLIGAVKIDMPKLDVIEVFTGWTQFGTDEQRLDLNNVAVNQVNIERFSGLLLGVSARYMDNGPHHWHVGGNFHAHPFGLTRKDAYEQRFTDRMGEHFYEGARKIDSSGFGFQINGGADVWKIIGLTASYQFRQQNTPNGVWGFRGRVIPEEVRWDMVTAGVTLKF